MSWFFQPIPAATTGPNQTTALDCAVVKIIAPDLVVVAAISVTLDVATIGVIAPSVTVTAAISVALDAATVGIVAPDVTVSAAFSATLSVATVGVVALDLTAVFDQAVALDAALVGLIAIDVTATTGGSPQSVAIDCALLGLIAIGITATTTPPGGGGIGGGMTAPVLAAALQALEPTFDEAVAVERLADAYVTYAQYAEAGGSNPILPAGLALGRAAFAAAVVGISMPDEGTQKLVDAIQAFWAAVAGGLGTSFAGATAIVAPAASLDAGDLQPVFDANVADSLSLEDAVLAVAVAIHAEVGGGTVTTAGPVVTPIT